MMKTMVSLIGEQPIPNLLPALHLKPDKTFLVYTSTTEAASKRLQQLIPNCYLTKTSAYELAAVLADLRAICRDEQDLIFNLTGGTKVMALAGYALALERQSDFVYLQSEGNTSLLFRYKNQGHDPVLVGKDVIPALITCEDYLRAYLPGFREEGFHRDATKQLSSGGHFEQAIYDTLKNDFELLAGVRPEQVGDQIEIDLVMRCQNRVGIAEIKLGDSRDEGPKKGLDQLSTAARREYLGTYVVKFLITARQLTNKKFRTLAQENNVHIIELTGYDDFRFRLSDQDKKRLIMTIREKLCGGR